MASATQTTPAGLSREVPRPRKKLLQRAPKDYSQRLRRMSQWLFLALNAALGAQFYFFVRQYELGQPLASVARPAGIEGWLPIAALMNLKYTMVTGSIPPIHPAGMFLLLAFLTISIVFRKAFCSWLCPVGTISEWMWKIGRGAFKRTWMPPRWADVSLRALKYILLGLFLWAVGSMSAESIRSFLMGPYGIVADVKMLNFFRFPTRAAAITLAFLFLFSFFVPNFWCRYLCPYGALMGLAALASPARIRREPEPCIDCAKCAKACPAALPVDRLVTIRSAECSACLECVAVCPAEGALALSLPRRRIIAPWMVAAGLTVIFFGVVGFAKWSGHWESDIPEVIYRELVPRANEFAHP